MGVATLAEDRRGTPFAIQYFYHSIWFICLWLAACICFCIGYLRMVSHSLHNEAHGSAQSKKQTWAHRHVALQGRHVTHASLVIIAIGAFVSYCTSKSGTLDLTVDSPTSNYTVTNSDETGVLPFPVTLKKAETAYYAGTESARDYSATLSMDRGQNRGKTYRLSMNHTATHREYRFYLYALPEPEHAVVLFRKDPFGLPITYTGYLLFFISMGATLLSKRGRFRYWLRRTTLPVVVFVAALCAQWPHSTHAQNITHTLAQTATTDIPPQVVEQLNRLRTLHNGRIAPMHTVAMEMVQKITGKSTVQGKSYEQVFWQWLFYFDRMKQQPLLHVKNHDLRQRLGTHTNGRYRLVDFFSPTDGYLLQPFLVAYDQGNHNKANEEAVSLSEKIDLLFRLRQGALPIIYPYAVQHRLQWFAPTDSLPNEVTPRDRKFILMSLEALKYSLDQGDSPTALKVVHKLHLFQQAHAGRFLSSKNKISAEILLNRIYRIDLLYKIMLALGTLLFMLYTADTIIQHRSTNTPTEHPTTHIHRLMPAPFVCTTISTIANLFLCFLLGLRWYVTGVIPLTNGADTLLVAAWLLLLLTILVGHRVAVMRPIGWLMTGFALLTASLAHANPQLTPLMPVLHSPLLSIHVSVIMIAYALLVFTFLLSLTALVLTPWMGHGSRRTNYARSLQALVMVLLFPAVYLLGVGIFIGAIWANVSWGNYWQWDPKETWALVTFIAYSAPLHLSIFPSLRHPMRFHMVMASLFALVLMTYFGVNYLLTGMHSYA